MHGQPEEVCSSIIKTSEERKLRSDTCTASHRDCESDKDM